MSEPIIIEVGSPGELLVTVDHGSGNNPGNVGAAPVRVYNEVPDGVMDGSNATFEAANAFIPETLEVFLNGLKQKIIDDYNTSGNFQITLTVSPENDEKLSINYSKL